MSDLETRRAERDLDEESLAKSWIRSATPRQLHALKALIATSCCARAHAWSGYLDLPVIRLPEWFAGIGTLFGRILVIPGIYPGIIEEFLARNRDSMPDQDRAVFELALSRPEEVSKSDLWDPYEDDSSYYDTLVRILLPLVHGSPCMVADLVERGQRTPGWTRLDDVEGLSHLHWLLGWYGHRRGTKVVLAEIVAAAAWKKVLS